ncbi:MAG: tRNA pseudouridine(55) synthase TruB [Candidatus Omnitrophica bacterium]|nr:tRNA pseudouridine(55) synthase TruB [Candidatus Omnitrophota bacterium]
MDGLLIVDKPAGLTSHDVVDVVRRRLGMRRVGHAGTLDPMATGVLILLIGQGTKLAATLSQEDKVYEGRMRLGLTTDTGDVWGTPRGSADYAHVTPEALAAAMARLVGAQEQTPPPISAAKYRGRPLYDWTRRGIEVPRKARPITVHAFTLLDVAPPEAGFRLHCSKGTYVRSLVEDVGTAVGSGACVSSLRRMRSGSWALAEAMPWPAVETMTPATLSGWFRPMPRVVFRTAVSS